MRIGIDAREFKKGTYTGLRTVMWNFLTHVNKTDEHEFILFGNQYTDMHAAPTADKKIVLNENITFLWDQITLPSALKEEKIDVFFSPYIKTPLWRVCPYVNTVADIIPLKISKYTGIRSFLDKAYFILAAFISSMRAVKTVTISNASKDDIEKVLRIPESKIEVAYISAGTFDQTGSDMNAEICSRGDKIDAGYVLYVGNFKLHRNLERLIEAYSMLSEDIQRAAKLVLVGGASSDMERLREIVSEKNMEEHVVLFGTGLSDCEIKKLMDKAVAFVFPSLCEGFGLPPLEAMACSVPVAASEIKPLTEVLGEAAVYFDPIDPASISKALSKLLQEDNLRRGCIEKGLERVKLFTPETMSKKLLSIIEDVGEEKTLLVSSEFPPIKGGISTTVFNLWGRLPREKTVVLTAKAAGGEEDLPDEDFDIVRETYPSGRSLPARIIRTILVIWHVWRQNCLRRIKCNHCAQLISSGLAGLIVRKLKGTPYVVYVYSADILEFDKNPVTRWLMRRVLEECERVVTCSRFSADVAIRYGSVSEEKILVNTPGVDTDVFNPDRGTGDIRTKYRIPNGHKILLTVSRLDARKGHDMVIQEMPSILSEYPGLSYVIVGAGENKSKLEELVKEKGLTQNVIFIDECPLEELVHFYNACDIFIMVPRYIEETGNVEGFGTVYLEANACGKPVIAGKSGGVSEAVIDGETGILVDPEDISQVKKAILSLLKDEEYAKKLGEKGMKRVKEEFNWDSRAKELKKYI